ncbi:MAG: hypothetical protein DMF51_17675 [Acidobacteria bacterium]|nr:MAG: hypothetical protein DMF51_17675 [Acidobacteriota bacterium]
MNRFRWRWVAPAVVSGIAVRACRPVDRAGLIRLGHPPMVADILCPSPARALLWRLKGTRCATLVAEEMDTGMILGAVQFVRCPRPAGTWMFGHWRVAAGRRRQGIGRRLLREGARLLPDAQRLYSFVDWGNDASIAAHERCGFEAGRSLFGSAPLGLLSTIGPATPALRLEPAGRREWPVLCGLYARAMGSLWLRLRPGLRPRAFLGGALSGLRGALVAVVRGASRGARSSGFVLWEGATVTFFADPEACDAALLARVALQVAALGGRRDSTLELRGLPAGLAERPGPFGVRVLMGMPDVPTQWSE